MVYVAEFVRIPALISADPAGTNHFVTELRADATSERVINQILSSDEFVGRATRSA